MRGYYKQGVWISVSEAAERAAAALAGKASARGALPGVQRGRALANGSASAPLVAARGETAPRTRQVSSAQPARVHRRRRGGSRGGRGT